MERTYKLNSGEKIRTWYNDLGYITIMDDSGNGKETFQFDRHAEDPTFIYNGETIHINNFDHLTAEELMQKVRAGEHVMEKDAIACIMKEHQKLGFVMEHECYDMFVPCMGIAMKGGGQKIRCMLVLEEDRYKIKDWHYKVDLFPYDQRIRAASGGIHTYFSDIWSGVMSHNWIELVLREEYLAEHPDEMPKDGISIPVML